MQTLQNVLLLWKWFCVRGISHWMETWEESQLGVSKNVLHIGSGLENRGYLDALDNISFNLPEKWAALFWQKPLTLLVEASALPMPTGHPGPGAAALLGLWGMFWNHRCSPLLLFASATLPSFGSPVAELPQA